MPPKEIRELFILETTAAKLLGKGITSEDVRQAVANSAGVRKEPRKKPGQTGRCYFVEGKTDAGRTIKALLRRFDGGTAMLITAWLP